MVLVILLGLHIFLYCQFIEEGWQGVKPLRATKSDVEKLFGKPSIDGNGYYKYKTGDVFIRVDYSTAPCQGDQYDRGRYDVPVGTVLSYSLHPSKLEPLNQIAYRRERYYRDESGDTNSISLINRKDGVVIGIQEQQGTEYFAGAEFQPSQSDAELFKCGK